MDFNLTNPAVEATNTNDSKGNSTQTGLMTGAAKAAAAVPSPHSVTMQHGGSTNMSLSNGK